MIFHIGKGNTLRQEDIIGIFDLDNATVSGITRRFLANATAEKKVSYGDSDIPRSFLLVGGQETAAARRDGVQERASRLEKRRARGKKAAAGVRVYLSHISSGSLADRAENPLAGYEEE